MIRGVMRPLQIDAAVIAVLTGVAHFTGHSTVAAFLGWFVFPLAILADWLGERRKSREKDKDA
jgi:hypothetical protein